MLERRQKEAKRRRVVEEKKAATCVGAEDEEETTREPCLRCGPGRPPRASRPPCKQARNYICTFYAHIYKDFN